MPNMVDPYFAKSVIFLCEDDKNGTIGIIINKPISQMKIVGTGIKNKIFEDIKINLNKVKVNPLPKNISAHYYKLDFGSNFYLYDELQRDGGYEYGNTNITETKKYWLKRIKEELNNISNENYIYYFEEGLNKYGKLKCNEYPFEIRLEIYSMYCEKHIDNNKLLDFISK